MRDLNLEADLKWKLSLSEAEESGEEFVQARGRLLYNHIF